MFGSHCFLYLYDQLMSFVLCLAIGYHCFVYVVQLHSSELVETASAKTKLLFLDDIMHAGIKLSPLFIYMKGV
jgi:hypothetical protein